MARFVIDLGDIDMSDRDQERLNSELQKVALNYIAGLRIDRYRGKHRSTGKLLRTAFPGRAAQADAELAGTSNLGGTGCRADTGLADRQAPNDCGTGDSTSDSPGALPAMRSGSGLNERKPVGQTTGPQRPDRA